MVDTILPWFRVRTRDPRIEVVRQVGVEKLGPTWFGAE